MEFLEKWNGENPFFMTLSPPACHAPFTPAPRHKNTFKKVKATHTPNFNVKPVRKHWLVGMPPTALPNRHEILDYIQRNRLRTLLAVDEMVEEVISKMKSLKVEDNTYVIFLSDNGYHIGQFSLPWDKRQPYETDIRIPFFIKGPGVKKKQVVDVPVSAVDLLPTILELSDVEIPADVDGRSFKSALFSRRELERKYVFIEYFGEGNPKSVDKTCPWIYDENLSECSKESWCKCQDSRNNTYKCVLEITEDVSFKFCHFQDDSVTT